MVFPAHMSAGGKALLSELPIDALDEIYLGGHRLARNDGSLDFVRLKTELAQVRKNGYALNIEETEEGSKDTPVPEVRFPFRCRPVASPGKVFLTSLVRSRTRRNVSRRTFGAPTNLPSRSLDQTHPQDEHPQQLLPRPPHLSNARNQTECSLGLLCHSDVTNPACSRAHEIEHFTVALIALWTPLTEGSMRVTGGSAAL
jgi:hypothetical protein